MVVYSVEYSQSLRSLLISSETGRPKLLLYNRPPSGHINVGSIRLVATFPMSLGTSFIAGDVLTCSDHLCPLHTISLDTGDICIIFVLIPAHTYRTDRSGKRTRHH